MNFWFSSFWFTLLLDSLPLLEMKIGTPVFSHEDSNILLATLEELGIGWVDNPVKKSHNFNDQIKIIRLAITKNLARTLLLQSNAPTNSNTIICYWKIVALLLDFVLLWSVLIYLLWIYNKIFNSVLLLFENGIYLYLFIKFLNIL